MSNQTAQRVWVPNRNGILLNIAAGFAEGLSADAIVPGFNAEEAATFPDNSEAFMGALDSAFQFSTATGVKVICFSSALDKAEIVKKSISLKVPLKDLWPCYMDGLDICRSCESCQRFLRALERNGVEV
jgi:7-cyano-7-deazaguanine synthase